MARFPFLILFLLLLAGCAQVGTLSGGPEDQYAPQIKNSRPANGSLNYTDKSIEIEFDEFIVLKDVAKSVIMLPPDAKIKVSAIGKKLLIDWEEDLSPNTTYVIYMNGTVSDFTAGNDTLIQYVFSTGDFIDSLKYVTFVRDAFTNQPIKDITIGLYPENADSVKPTYFARTDAGGKAELSYVKEGNYILRAFEDVNSNLLVEKSEKSGFKDERIYIDSSIVDSMPVRISSEVPPVGIRTFVFRAPGQFIIGASGSLNKADLYFNDQIVKEDQITRFSNDSISFLANVQNISLAHVKIEDSLWQDSISLKIENAQRTQKATVENNLYNSTLLPNESLQIMVSDRFAEVDKEKIRVFNAEDSTFRDIDSIVYTGNKMQLYFDRTNLRDVELLLDSSAYRTETSASDSIRLRFNVKTVKDYGTLLVDLSNFEENLIVQMNKDGKKVEEIITSKEKEISIPYLEPGNYTITLILDRNANGKWDAGSYSQRQQPEEVYHYRETINIRANWDMEVILE